ncbi:hypothetical protein MKEN_00986400 [Mycena kentingensis (nom. inval.)]|nr:hypothetical protein MKEN_00986400 [Mycena kentingensis (nom. inval.)]
MVSSLPSTRLLLAVYELEPNPHQSMIAILAALVGESEDAVEDWFASESRSRGEGRVDEDPLPRTIVLEETTYKKRKRSRARPWRLKPLSPEAERRQTYFRAFFGDHAFDDAEPQKEPIPPPVKGQRLTAEQYDVMHEVYAIEPNATWVDHEDLARTHGICRDTWMNFFWRTRRNTKAGDAYKPSGFRRFSADDVAKLEAIYKEKGYQNSKAAKKIALELGHRHIRIRNWFLRKHEIATCNYT